MRIKELSETYRPRERLLRYGASALSDAELLALVLRTGTREENAVAMCERLLSACSLSRLPSCSPAELRRVRGIGEAKACQIIAAFALQQRMRNTSGRPLRSAKDVYAYAAAQFTGERQERFLALLLDTKNRVTREETISVGTLNCSLVHPREVFASAVRERANAVIVVHNHPSGDPAPSAEDREVTRMLKEAGKLLGIAVLDHIIIGDGRWYSFKENEG